MLKKKKHILYKMPPFQQKNTNKLMYPTIYQQPIENGFSSLKQVSENYNYFYFYNKTKYCRRFSI